MTLRIGIVGCGAIAEDMHIPTALRSGKVKLTAVVDCDISRAKHIADKYDINHAASELREIVNYVDAIIVATPPHTHLVLTQEAFRYGIHVLCEKPLANTFAECEKITRTARENNCVLAVVHMFRFYPIRKNLLELVEEHSLGRITKLIATEGKPYTWDSVSGYTVRKELVPGGVMINAGIHTLDSILWWFGDPSKIEYQDDSAGGLESNLRLKMHFKNGIEAVFRESRTCNLPFLIRVEAEFGSIEFDTNSVASFRLTKNGRTIEMDCDENKLTHQDCWGKELEDLVNSVQTGNDPVVTGEEGTRVIRLIEECYKLKSERKLPGKAFLPGLTW